MLKFRIIIYLILCFCLTPGSFASLVDKPDIQLLRVTASDVRYSDTLRANIPDRNAICKAFQSQGLPAPDQFFSIARLSHADVYDGGLVMAVLSKTSTGNTEGASRILALKEFSIQRSFGGFHMLFPSVVLRPYSTDVKLKDNPTHIFLIPKLQSIKTMRDIIKCGIVHGMAADLRVVYSFGCRLGQFQSGSIRKVADEYVADAHLKLDYGSVLYTAKSKVGTLGEFTLTNLSHLVLGDEKNAYPISVDVIYFLMRSMAMAVMDPSLSHQAEPEQKSNFMAFIDYFYRGYISAFDETMANELRTYYTSIRCVRSSGNHTKFPIPLLPYKGQYGDHFFNEILFPSINNVYVSREMPRQFFIKGFRVPVPADFDPEVYLLHVDLKHETRNFSNPEERLIWACQHYSYLGHAENRCFALPLGFNPLRYLEVNQDLRAEMARLKMTPEQFSPAHWVNAGRNERGRKFK